MTYIDDLAAEYFTAYLNASPTEAHVLGQYAWADRFEVFTREEEDRQIAELRGFVAAGEAIRDDDLDEQQPRYLGGSIDRLVFQVKPVDAPYPVALRAYSRPAALLDTLPVANQLFSSSALRAPQPEVPAAL